VLALAAGCRFRDCAHQAEPGCAVRAAVADGRLDASRLESYLKLQAELHSMEVREDPLLRREQLGKWRAAFKSLRKNPKHG